MLESEDNPEIGISETALLRRHRALIAGMILASIGGIMITVYFLYPYPALGYPLNIRLGMLGGSLFSTGFASVSGSLLVWPKERQIGYFFFRFLPRAKLFVFSVGAAAIFWCFFILSLDTVDRAIVGCTAGLIVIFAFAITRKKRLPKKRSDATSSDPSAYGLSSVDSQKEGGYFGFLNSIKSSW